MNTSFGRKLKWLGHVAESSDLSVNVLKCSECPMESLEKVGGRRGETTLSNLLFVLHNSNSISVYQGTDMMYEMSRRKPEPTL